MSENRFENFNAIVDNFDAFCDEFESRAAEAFLRGDQNNGRVIKAAEGDGDNAPEAVREIAEPGPADNPIGETYVDVSSYEDE